MNSPQAVGAEGAMDNIESSLTQSQGRKERRIPKHLGAYSEGNLGSFCRVVGGEQPVVLLLILLQQNDLQIRLAEKRLGSFCKIRILGRQTVPGRSLARD